jgi:hypothetical protein
LEQKSCSALDFGEIRRGSFLEQKLHSALDLGVILRGCFLEQNRVLLWTLESFGDRGCFSKQNKIAFCSGLQRELDMRQHKTTIISSTTTTTMMASKDKDTCTSQEQFLALPYDQPMYCKSVGTISGLWIFCKLWERSLLLEITNHSPLVNGTHT